MEACRAAREDQLQAERDRAAARGGQYAQVVEIGPLWDVGAPLSHLVSNGSSAFVACLASQPGPDWTGPVNVVSPADANASLFVVIEMRGCSQLRFGAPGGEAMSGHPLYSKGLDGYRAHEVFNSRWTWGGDQGQLGAPAPLRCSVPNGVICVPSTSWPAQPVNRS